MFIDACSSQLARSCWPLHEGNHSTLTNVQHTGIIQSLRKGKNSEAGKLQTLSDEQLGHLVNPVPGGKEQFLQVPERTQSLGCGRQDSHPQELFHCEQLMTDTVCSLGGPTKQSHCLLQRQEKGSAFSCSLLLSAAASSILPQHVSLFQAVSPSPVCLVHRGLHDSSFS